MEEVVRWKKRVVPILAVSVLLIVFGGFFKPLFVFAEQGDFLVEPLYHEVDLSNDDTEKFLHVDLSNRTGEDATFAVSVVDFGTLDESGGIAFLGGGGGFEQRYGLASWVKVGSDSFIVPAGKSERVPITIENKESLSPGGHYGAVLFRMLKPGGVAADSPTVAIESSFAALIFVRKTGGEIAELAYKGSGNMTHDFVGLPDGFSLRFQNSGNVHLVPRGQVTVSDIFGRVVRKGIVNVESGRILPESFRTIRVGLRPVAHAFFPGFYSVAFEYRYDGKDSFETVTERVFPLALTVFWIAGVFAAIFGMRFVMKKRSGKKGRDESRHDA